jgi:two-component system cell cycle sensor histidine kinase/response regulator CckA
MLLRRLIGEKVKLDLVHGRDLWPVKVDVSQFEQVIVNLAVNARDAMPEGGKLTVRTGNLTTQEAARLAYKGMPAAEYVRIDITDTGTGIPAEIVDKIFEPFFSTKEVGKGTGLGLSQAFGFAKQSDGDIAVASTLGHGATFTIYLPQAARPASEAEKSGIKSEPAATGRGYRVLLVEDNDDVGIFSTELL